jgi:hypothetical protein
MMSKHTSPFILTSCPASQFDLPLPDGLEEQLSPEQAKKVGKVQVKFAHGVSDLLSKSYGEVSAILDEQSAQSPRGSSAK